MIGKIRGTLEELEGNLGLIETKSGVSYELFLTSSVLGKTKIGDVVDIYTYLQIRDDAQVLYGFSSATEKKFFKLLLGVDGVGPRIAFSVVSFTKESEVMAAVKSNDISYFQAIPGLGKKTAMKILLELSQKLDSEFKLEKMYLSEEEKTVIDALVSLGFRTNEAKTLLSKLPKKLTVEEKIKEALRSSSSLKSKV